VPSSKNAQSIVEAALVEHLPSVWRFALSLSGNPSTADDLAQATSLRALEKAYQLVDTQNPVAWLLTICRSIWLNQLRSEKIRASQSLDSTAEIDLVAISAEAETNIFASQVFSRVMALPEAQRETVLLVYVEGFTYREAAKLLDVPMGTVMSRLAAARAKLADLRDAPDSDKQGIGS